MILLNFSHPITTEQHQQIEVLTGQALTEIINVPVMFDNNLPFLPQVEQLLETVTLNSQTWQSRPLLVNLPSYNYISAMLLAGMHGLMGYFPSIMRIRPVTEGPITGYEVAEIINLQAIRGMYREQRSEGRDE